MSDAPVVLVVEDELLLLDIYVNWLEDQYEVRAAGSGEEALEQCDDVDVVLLDRLMPGQSGDEVLAVLRDRGATVQVAMVTAVEPDFDILEMGFDAYLSKPIRSEQLHETVENLLERSEYDSVLQEYYSLVEKQATLEASKSNAELEESDEYDELESEIDELQDELSESLGGIGDDADFIATLRGLSNGEEE